MATPPQPPALPAGALYCTVCVVEYAKGIQLPQGAAVPFVAIMWLPTIFLSGLLPVCWWHGLQFYVGA